MRLVQSVLRKVKKRLRRLTNGSDKAVRKPSIQIGKHTYGFENIKTSWGSGAEVIIGNFTSIALNLNIQLGGNHNLHWVSAYPFDHVSKNNQALFGPAVLGHPAPP